MAAIAEQIPLFAEARLPRRPYCADELSHGLKIRPLRIAATMPYIQINPPHLRFWAVFDVDRPGGGIAWEDAMLPPPAWAAINPTNTHAHIAWGLSAPVLTGDAARLAPLRYMAAIEGGFAAALDADPGYSGLVTKNPLSPIWRVMRGPQRLWGLDEMAEWVDLTRHAPSGRAAAKPEHYGLGRNCLIFDLTRVWSYHAVRAHRELRNLARWQAEVFDRALTYNGDLPVPLSPQEVGHIAKSVAKWTWKRDAEARAAFHARQRAKGRKGGQRSGEARRLASEDQRASARLMAAAGRTIRDISAELGIPRSTVGRWVSHEA